MPLKNGKQSLPVGSIILVAGSPGVGKTFAIKEILPKINNVYLLEKDNLVEDFFHSNPFFDSDKQDKKISFHDKQYKDWIRNQGYASMFRIAMANAKLGISTILDACWIGWLKDRYGKYSLAKRIVNFFDKEDREKIRIPILYFYCPDDKIVKRRIQDRIKIDPVACDRDWDKVKDEKSWQEQIRKEPTGLFDELKSYRDILFIDRSNQFRGKEKIEQTERIISFLCHSNQRTVGNSGIFLNESLEETIVKLRR